LAVEMACGGRSRREACHGDACLLTWRESGIVALPRKVFRLKRITSESFPLFAHYVGKFFSGIDVRLRK